MRNRSVPENRSSLVPCQRPLLRGLAPQLGALALGALLLPACLGGVQLRSVRSFSALDYGMAEKFVTVGGVRICYAEQGRGEETVVLLAPSLSPLSVWRDVAAELGKKARVIALDLPGAGKSDKPPRFPYTPDTFAQVVARLLDQLGVASATLVGNSNGGGTALAFALRYPERTRRLVLLAPSGVKAAAPWQQRGLRWAMQTRHLRANPYTLRVFFNAGVFGQTNARTDAYISDQLAIRGAGEEFAAYLRAQQKTVRNTLAFNAGPRLGEVKAPTLILWGEKDKVLPRRLGERLRAGIRGSELVVLPGLGHLPEVESPDAVARLVDGFLARTKPAAATLTPAAKLPGPAGGTPAKPGDEEEKDDDKDDGKESKE